jgi:hypothetical protein
VGLARMARTIKERMNGTVGWWIDRTTFFSVKQLKSILNQKKQL